MSDYADRPGRISVFTDDWKYYCPWKSRLAMARAYLHWFRKIAKQALCRHPQPWSFNACGRMTLPADEAARWYSPWGSNKTEPVDMIRINYRCRHCGIWRHVYVPACMVSSF